MTDSISRLEALVARLGGASSGDGDADGGNAVLDAYNAYYTASVQPFVDACNSLDGSKALGAAAETAWTGCKVVFDAAQQCKKPEPADLFKLIDPVVQVVMAAEAACDRKSDFFNHQKAFAEMISVMNWLLQPLPKPFILGQIEAADFYLTKVLTASKDQPDAEKAAYRAFVKTMKTMIQDLAAFAFAHCKTGVQWNVRGDALADFKAGAGGSGGSSSGKAAAAAPAEAMSDSLKARLDALSTQLEAHLNSGDDDDEGDGELCKSLADWDAYHTAHVMPFVDACNSAEGSKALGAFTVDCFATCRTFIRAAAAAKKPDDAATMKLLDPIVKVITGMDAACDRKSDFFNHQKAFAEMIPVMNWLLQPLPKPFILGQIEAADFYLTKVLTASKDQPDAEKAAYRAFVKTMKTMIQELAAFAFAHHKTGVEWNNAKGVALSEWSQ